MLQTLIKGLSSIYIQYSSQHISIRLTILLAASIFLPLYLTIPAIIYVSISFLRLKDEFALNIRSPYKAMLMLLEAILLIVPLLHRNYWGFCCGIALILILILEINISRIMTGRLFDRICDLIYGFGIVNAAVAIFQKAAGLQERVTAFTNNANYYAYMIEFIVILCFYRYVKTKKPMALIALAANLAALAFTGSRSAWIGLLIGLAAFCRILQLKKYHRVLVVLILVLGAAVYFYPSLLPRYSILDDSLTDRFRIWSGALKDFIRNPLFGRGLLAYYQITGSKITPHAHCLYLDLLESTGLIGTALVFCIFLTIVKQLVLAYRFGNRKARERVALCGAMIAATLVHGFTDTPIIGFQTGMLFALVLSIRPKCSSEALYEHKNKRGYAFI